MKKIEIKQNEELEKVPVMPGDVVFVKYDRGHKPLIQVFNGAIPC